MAFARNQMREAVEYLKVYGDKMNEVQIVTMKSDAEIAKLGGSYRNLAREMKVNSFNIAEAAVEFWRQGLPDEDVNERLKYTTMYAKISALEFKEAAELVTSATNSMNLSAQKVVDVFSYLGDASASGADEIGKAMQKSSAAAQEAGLSFEWLGTYIATVSEKTRLQAEVIGTSFNSMLARLHSIKQKGYNEEDETKINDIAKALDIVGLKLLDQQGKWIEVSDIFGGVAAKWDALNDKQRAYIATTIAGTRQQNVFLNLMADMSKGAEGGSRAFELYEGAVNAAGAATEKYAIYQKSVTAAQDSMRVGFERLYALGGSDVIRGWYSLLAGIANGMADLFEAPATEIERTKDAISELGTKRLATREQIQQIEKLKDEYERLSEQVQPTKEEQEQMNQLLGRLAQISPQTASAVVSVTGQFKNQKEVLVELNDLLCELTGEYGTLSRLQATQTLRGLSQEYNQAWTDKGAFEQILTGGRPYVDTILKAVQSGRGFNLFKEQFGFTTAQAESAIASFKKLMKQLDLTAEDEAEKIWQTLLLANKDNQDVLTSLSAQFKQTFVSAAQLALGEGDPALMQMASSWIDDLFGSLESDHQLIGLKNAEYATSLFHRLLAYIDEIKGSDIGGELRNYAKTYNELYAAVEKTDGGTGFDEAVSDLRRFTEEYNAFLSQHELEELPYLDASYWEDVFKTASDGASDAAGAVGEATKSIAKMRKEAAAAYTEMTAKANGYITTLTALAGSVHDDSFDSAWAELSDDMRGSLSDMYPEILKIAGGLADVEEAATIMQEALKAANDTMKQASYDKFSKATSTLNSVNAALTKIGKTGKDAFSREDIDSLIEAYPELLLNLDNQEAMERRLTEIKGEQEQAQRQAYQAMLASSEAYWNQLLSGNHQLTQALAAVYGADASNFKSYSQVKADIDTMLRKAIGAEWQKMYGSLGAGVSAISSKLLGQMQNRGGMGNAINELKGLTSLADQLDNIGSTISGIKIGGTGGISVGSGGGSGRSGGVGKDVSEIDALLDRLRQLQAIVDFNREMASLAATYHKNKGELQGVITYLEKEKKIVEENAPVLRKNVQVLDEQIQAKKKEIAALTQGTDAYNAANEELASLQDAHQEYSKALMQNKIDIDALGRQLKEVQDEL